MVRVDTGGWVDLQAVVAVAGVLKEAVHGVQHVMGQVEKPFPGNTANNIALVVTIPKCLQSQATCNKHPCSQWNQH